MVIGLFVSNVLNIALLKSAVDNWWRYDSIFAYVASVSLLLMFLNINKIDSTTKFSKFISAVSASTFGVYLIHAHADVCIENGGNLSALQVMLMLGGMCFINCLLLLLFFGMRDNRLY